MASLSKSKRSRVSESAAPLTIGSLPRNTATGRRPFLSPATASCEHPKDAGSRLCLACYDAIRMASAVPLECAHCQSAFSLPRFDYEKRWSRGVRRFFCNRACFRARRAAETMTRECKTCATPVRKGLQYCSAPCWPKPVRSTMPEKACPQCAAVFTPVSSRSQFCSRTCANRAHAKRMTGSGNSRFVDGSSYAEWFRQMRPIVLERDGWKCVACSAAHELVPNGRGGMKSMLVIHHCDEKPQNNLPENLITMCATCHMLHHKSKTTPFPWLQELAQARSTSMTSRLKRRTASLRSRFLSTTA